MSIHLPDSSRALGAMAKVLFLAVALTGCGGGGSTATSTAAKTSFAAGRITGFGSVIVNGTRFDDSTATVANDDDEAQTSSDLKLGMMAEVEAGEITSDTMGSHGEAKAIHSRSAIVGPVDSIATDGKSLVVLGQTVDVTATTVFDDRLARGLGSITAGDVVEVFAMLDATTGHYTATRIEPKANATLFKLRGVVGSLDTMAHTFKIGTETISYGGLAADQVPADLANGLLVRVKLQMTQVSGAWVATKLKSAVRHMDDHDEAELKGLITSFTSTTQFSVDGIAVDATNAKFPDGTTGIVLGAQVEVQGASSNGVIVATKVSIETQEQDKLAGFELHGAITTLDTTAKTFVLRGVTVSYGGTAVVYVGGMESDLAVGRKVEVKGTPSTDGTKLDATTIKFES